MKKQIVVSVFIFLTLVFSGGFVRANAAYTTSVSSNQADDYMDFIDAVYMSAENYGCFSGKTEFIRDSISNAYDVNIYHYKAPVTGYYDIEIAGSSSVETCISVIQKEKKSIFSKVQYVVLGKSDKDYSYDYNGYKSHLVVFFTKGQDYFVCVRGYGKQIGNYQLNIIDNRDLKKNTGVGLTWTALNYSNGKSISQINNIQGGFYPESFVYKKYDLTRKEIILLYYFILQKKGIQIKIDGYESYTPEVLNRYMRTNPQLALKVCNGILTALSFAPEVGIVASAASVVISAAIECNTTGLLDTIENKLQSLCGLSVIADSDGKMQIVTGKNEFHITEKRMLYELSDTTQAKKTYKYKSSFEFRGYVSNSTSGEYYYAGKWE